MVFAHAPCHRGSGHEYTRVVDFDHFVHVFDGVLGCGTDLLNPCCVDEAVYALFLSRDLEGKGVELLGVANVAFCRGCGVSITISILERH